MDGSHAGGLVLLFATIFLLAVGLAWNVVARKFTFKLVSYQQLEGGLIYLALIVAVIYAICATLF
ncbi:MAG: hypothetical protein EOO23_03595 [Comamonadaceae bacterium]|nr:MAG: hypothetical protein EOO23_03595 [Comamonadaceae bacterium]